MQAIVMKEAWLKAFTSRIGHDKSKITICAPLTAELARALKFFSAVFQQDGTPKQEIVEVELSPIIRNFDLKIDASGIPLVLHMPSCLEASKFIAKRKGSTKKGQASRLIIEFKVLYRGTLTHFMEWAERYGTMQGDCVISPTEENGDLFAEPAKAEKKKRGRPAGSGKNVTMMPAVPAVAQ